jgi:CBS domain-containing protein
VLDNKKVVGLISIGDVVNKIIIDQKNTIQYLEDYIIRG